MGEPQAVADALAEMEQPHTSADAVPASVPGALLALGDRYDLLAAMFGLGAKPSGSSDPFGLRRAALGVVRVLRERTELSGLTLRDGLEDAAARLAEQGITCPPESLDAAEEFIVGRYAQLMRDEGHGADVVSAVSPAAARPGQADVLARDLESLAGDAQFHSLVEQVVRIRRLLPAGTEAGYDAALLTEPAEVALREAVEALPAQNGNLCTFAQDGASLVGPIATFFDDILVMAKEEDIRAARLGLLATVLASAPEGLDWQAVDAATA